MSAQGSGDRGPTGTRIRILVVEDNEPNLRLLGAFLESHGYEVEAAASLGEAIAKSSDSEFDLILSDLRLQDESGFRLCEEVRRSNGRIRFLLYTVAAITEADRQRAQEVGVDAFVHRTANVKEILPVIASLLAQN